MSGTKALPIVVLALAVQSSTAQPGQAASERLSIVVDQSCRVQLDSDSAVLGDHNDAFRDSAICHLESVQASRHVEERISAGSRDRSLVNIREHEFVLQNVTESPAVFVVRQAVPEDWSVDSDPQPAAMDGSTAIFRVFAEPGQIVRLHVGLRNAVSMPDESH